MTPKPSPAEESWTCSFQFLFKWRNGWELCDSEYWNSDPENQKYWADYWQFIKYPENPNTNVKHKIQELAEKKEKQQEQRRIYQEQLRALQQAAERAESFKEESQMKNPTSWWRRAGGWIVGNKQGSDWAASTKHSKCRIFPKASGERILCRQNRIEDSKAHLPEFL